MCISFAPSFEQDLTTNTTCLGYASRIHQQSGAKLAFRFLWNFVRHYPHSKRWIRSMQQIYASNGANPVPLIIIRKKCFFKYVSKQFKFPERSKLIEEHYLITAFLFSRYTCTMMLNMRAISLAHIEGVSGKIFSLSLVQRPELCSEGELSIILQEQCNGKRLATLTFLFVRKKFSLGILIGGMQGPNCENSKAEIVEATRELFGLRPKNAVLCALYAMCMVLPITHFESVSCKNNPSKKIGKAFKADNDGFWAEISNTMSNAGDFVLPLDLPERLLEQVPSKRRKLWQRRKCLKDSIKLQSEAQLSNLINPETRSYKKTYGNKLPPQAKANHAEPGSNFNC
jgi:uncharacterized protein